LDPIAAIFVLLAVLYAYYRQQQQQKPPPPTGAATGGKDNTNTQPSIVTPPQLSPPPTTATPPAYSSKLPTVAAPVLVHYDIRNAANLLPDGKATAGAIVKKWVPAEWDQGGSIASS
jgi:hypothetical protein